MDIAKSALITGVTGQDGAYLAKLLLDKGYTVYGGVRRASSINTHRLAALGIEKEVRFVLLDLLELTNVMRIIEEIAPDEIYNLAAQSFVATSFEQPIFTAEVNSLGVARILETLRQLGNTSCRFYQASTSEMFGKIQEAPQTEKTPFYPRSPYGVAKVYGHGLTVNYREAFGLHGSCGILFNHESPLRGADFVTRKITLGLANIKAGKQDVLELGNLDAKRDWGFAGDYVEAMWLMLQEKEPDDYVIATGQTHSIRRFAELAAISLDMNIEWDGEDTECVGRDSRSGKEIIRVNPKYYRPAEVDILVGDAGKARAELGWKTTMSFDGLVDAMARSDYDRVVRGGILF